MIIDKIKELTNLTNQEQAVADYIVENPSQILSMTMADLSLASYTSDATIIRLCKKLGFRGFTDFKYYFASQYHDISFNKTINAKDFVSHNINFNEFSELYPNALKRSIEFTKSNFSQAQLNRIANQILDSNKIMFFGLNSSYSLADIYAKRFAELGIDAIAETNLNFHIIAYLQTNKLKSFAILLSMSGVNSMVNEVVPKLIELNIPFLVITNNNKSAVLKDATESILVSYDPIDVLNRSLFMFSSQYVLEMIFQYIYLHKVKYIDKIVENIYESFPNYYQHRKNPLKE